MITLYYEKFVKPLIVKTPFIPAHSIPSLYVFVGLANYVAANITIWLEILHFEQNFRLPLAQLRLRAKSFTNYSEDICSQYWKIEKQWI